MNKFKRSLSVLLVLVMLVSLLPVNAFAEQSDNTAQNNPEQDNTASSNLNESDAEPAPLTTGQGEQKAYYEPDEEMGIIVLSGPLYKELSAVDGVYQFTIADASSSALCMIDIPYIGVNCEDGGEITAQVIPENGTASNYAEISVFDTYYEDCWGDCLEQVTLTGIGAAEIKFYADGYFIGSVRVSTALAQVVEGNIITAENFSNAKLLSALSSSYPLGLTEADAAEQEMLVLVDMTKILGDITPECALDLGMTAEDFNTLHTFFPNVSMVAVADKSSAITALTLPAWEHCETCILYLSELRSLTLTAASNLDGIQIISGGKLKNVIIDGEASTLKLYGNTAEGFDISGEGAYSPEHYYQYLTAKASGKKVDLGVIVGKNNLKKVTVPASDEYSYDASSGIVTLNADVSSFKYFYVLKKGITIETAVEVVEGGYEAFYYTEEILGEHFIFQDSSTPLAVMASEDCPLPYANSYELPFYTPEGEADTRNTYQLAFGYYAASEEDQAEVTLEISGTSSGKTPCVSLAGNGGISQNWNADLGIFRCMATVSVDAVGPAVISAKIGGKTLFSVPFTVHAAGRADNYKPTSLSCIEPELGNIMLFVTGKGIDPGFTYSLLPDGSYTGIFAYEVANNDSVILPTVTSSDESVVLPGEISLYPIPEEIAETFKDYAILMFVFETKDEGEATLNFKLTVDGTEVRLFSTDFTVEDVNASVLNSKNIPNAALLTKLRSVFTDGLTVSEAAKVESLELCNEEGKPISLNLSQSDIDKLAELFPGLYALTLADSASELKTLNLNSLAGITTVWLNLPQLETINGQKQNLNIHELKLFSGGVITLRGVNLHTLSTAEGGSIRGINLDGCTITEFVLNQQSINNIGAQGNVVDMKGLVGAGNLNKIVAVGGCYYNGRTHENEYAGYNVETGAVTLKRYSSSFTYAYEVSDGRSIPVEVGVRYSGTNILTTDYFDEELLKLLNYCGYSFLTEESIKSVTVLTQEKGISYGMKGLNLLTGLEILFISSKGNEAIDLRPWKNLKALILEYGGNKTPQITYADGVKLTDFAIVGDITDLSFVPDTVETIIVAACDKLAALDISKLQNLTDITLRRNTLLTDVDLSGSKLKSVCVDDSDTLQSLDLSNTALEKLILTGNNTLSAVTLEGVDTLKEVEITDNTALASVNLNSSPVEVLTATGPFILNNTGALKKIDIKNESVLTELNLSGAPVEELNVRYCSGLTSIDLSDCTGLKTVSIENNSALKSIDFSNCSAEEINVSGNQVLTSVNLDDCSSLKQLNITYNKLTTLNLSDCTALEGQQVPTGYYSYYKCIDCHNNAIETLILGDLPAETVYASNNCLTRVELNGFKGMVAAGYQRVNVTAVNGEVDISRFYRYNDLSEIFSVSINNKVIDHSSGKVSVGSEGSASYFISLYGSDNVNSWINGTMIITHAGKILLPQTEMWKAMGDSFTLTPTLRDGATGSITWTSSNSEVATVDGNGFVQTVGEGTAEIKATLEGEETPATCRVHVIALNSLTLDQDSLFFDMRNTSSKTLTATLNPADFPGTVTWTSSDPEVAEVYSNGTVQARKTGSCTVTATAGPLSASCQVTVDKPITVESKELKLYIGQTPYNLVPVISNLYPGASVTFSQSYDREYLEIEQDGNTALLTPKVTGNTTLWISLYDEDGYIAGESIAIDINIPRLNLYSYFNQPMYVGDNNHYSFYVYPADAELLWTSSDESVVTVDQSGNVKAVGAGTATITLSVNGFSNLSQSSEIVVRNRTDSSDIINRSNFYDEAFIRKLQKLFPDTLTEEDAGKVESLDLSGTYIEDFAGLNYFTGLKTLNLSDSGYSSLDLSAYEEQLNNVTIICDQTVTADVFGYVVEMNKLLGDGNINMVTIDSSVGSLDKNTGFLTLSGTPESFSYKYNTGAGEMTVTVDILNIVPQLPEEYLTKLYSNWFYLNTVLPDYDNYTYQWQLSTDGGKSFNDIDGAVSRSYHLYGERNMHGYLYRCLVTSSSTNAQVYSNATKLCITDLLSGIVFQPTSYFGADGDLVRMSVEAGDSKSALAYQWYRKSASGSAFVEIPGETSADLSFTLTSANSGTKYYCVITDGNGSYQTDEVTAAIGSGTTVTDDGILARDGETVTIDPGVSSIIIKACHFRWEKSNDGITFQSVDAGASPVLTTEVSAADHGSIYRLVLWDDYDHEVTSRNFVISIIGEQLKFAYVPDVICRDQYNGYYENIVAAAGEDISYICSYYFPDGTTKFYESAGNGLNYHSTALIGCKVVYTVTDAKGNSISTDPIPVTSSATVSLISSDLPENAVGGLINTYVSAGGFYTARWQLSTDGKKWEDVPSQYYSCCFERDLNSHTVLPVFRTVSRLMLPIESAEMDGNKLRCIFTDSCGNEMITNSRTISLQEGAYGITLTVVGHPDAEMRYPIYHYAVPGESVTVGIPLLSYSAVTLNGEPLQIGSNYTLTFTMPDGPAEISLVPAAGNSTITFNSQDNALPIYAKQNPNSVDYTGNTYSKDSKLTVGAGSEVSLRLYSSGSTDKIMINNVYIWANSGSGDTAVPYTVENGYYIFTAPEGNVTIDVEFKTAEVNITVQKSQNGSVTLESIYMSDQPPYVNFELSAEPDEGYEVEYYIIDGVKYEPNSWNNYRGRTAKDVTVSASFVPAKYEITWGNRYFDPNGNLNFTVNGEEVTTNSARAYAGDSIVVYLTPNSGYKAAGLYNSDYSPITLKKLAPTVFAFVMPAHDVSLISHYEKMEPWNKSSYGSPAVTIPGALQGVVSSTIDDEHNLTVRIENDTAAAWAAACPEDESGFITVKTTFTAVPGTVQTKGGYKNAELTDAALNLFEADPAAVHSAAEGDITTYELKIAAYRRNNNGTITIVPLSDAAAQDMRSIYQLYADLNDVDVGASYFNFHLDPQVLSAFTVTPAASAAYPEEARISWSFNDNLTYSYVNGKAVISPADSEFHVNDVTVPAENNVWTVCTVTAPEGYIASSVKDSAGESLSLCTGNTVTIRKPVSSPFTLNDVSSFTAYTVVWSDGSNTITEQFTLSVIGAIMFQGQWKPAPVTVQIPAESGISYDFDATEGRFRADIAGTTPPTLDALNTLIQVSIPDGAVSYRELIGYSEELYDASFADTQKALLSAKSKQTITPETKLGLPLFEVRENTLGGIRYAYSSNLSMRFALYEFYDENDGLIDTAYIVGESGAFIFGEVTVGVQKVLEEVSIPTIEGSDASLKVTYYPQNSSGNSYLIDLETAADPGENGITIYLPYSLTGHTYEELQGKTITVYHYHDAEDAEPETLTGECTEKGIKIVMKSFSPVVLDWTDAIAKPYTVVVCSRISGTNSTIANVSGGGEVNGSTTVTASNVNGYDFVGWFTNYSTTDNGTCVSKELSYTFTPEADVELIAVYTSHTGKKARVSINGSDKFEVNSSEQYSGFVDYFYIAEKVTIKYTGDKTFLYWRNNSGNIVSTAESYTFYVIGDAEYTAVTVDNNIASGKAYVVYLSTESAGQILSAKYITLIGSDSYSDSAPYTPTKLGQTFDGWYVKNADGVEMPATNENVTTLITSGQTPISIYAKYAVSGKYTVKLNIHWTPTVVKNYVYSYDYGTFGHINCVSEFSGYYFDRYEINGEVVGYSNELAVFTNDTEITVDAYYTTVKPGVKANVITIKDAGNNTEGGGANKHSYVSCFSVPTGEIATYGFLYTTRAADETELVYNNKQNVKSFEWDDADGKVGTMALNITASADQKISIRAFVVLTDGSVVYSEVV